METDPLNVSIRAFVAGLFASVVIGAASPALAQEGLMQNPPPPRVSTSARRGPAVAAPAKLPATAGSINQLARAVRAVDLAVASRDAAGGRAADALASSSRIEVKVGAGADGPVIEGVSVSPNEAFASETWGVSELGFDENGNLVATVPTESEPVQLKITEGEDGTLQVAIGDAPAVEVAPDGTVKTKDGVIGKIGEVGGPTELDALTDGDTVLFDADWVAPDASDVDDLGERDKSPGFRGALEDEKAFGKCPDGSAGGGSGLPGGEGGGGAGLPGSGGGASAPGGGSGAGGGGGGGAGLPGGGRPDAFDGGTVPSQTAFPPASATSEERFQHFANLVEQGGGSVDQTPGQRTVLGLRGVTPDGMLHPPETRNIRSYGDTFVVLWTDDSGRRFAEAFQGSTTPGQASTNFNGTPDVDRDGTKDIAHLRPGTYDYYARQFKGKSAYGNNDALPVVRDTSHDGRISDAERAAAAQRDDRARGILFHRGGASRPSSVGCQTMSPYEFDRFEAAMGGDRTFRYTLVRVSQ